MRHMRKGRDAQRRRQLRAALNRVTRGISVAAYLNNGGVKPREEK